MLHDANKSHFNMTSKFSVMKQLNKLSKSVDQPKANFNSTYYFKPDYVTKKKSSMEMTASTLKLAQTTLTNLHNIKKIEKSIPTSPKPPFNYYSGHCTTKKIKDFDVHAYEGEDQALLAQCL